MAEYNLIFTYIIQLRVFTISNKYNITVMHGSRGISMIAFKYRIFDSIWVKKRRVEFQAICNMRLCICMLFFLHPCRFHKIFNEKIAGAIPNRAPRKPHAFFLAASWSELLTVASCNPSGSTAHSPAAFPKLNHLPTRSFSRNWHQRKSNQATLLLLPRRCLEPLLKFIPAPPWETLQSNFNSVRLQRPQSL